MPGPVAPTIAATGSSTGRASYASALTLLASLFFMWGFITVINNTLLPHLKSVFDLNYTQTTLIESVWFIAYFFASIPSAKLIERIGYQRSLVVGLLIMAGGALGMTLAATRTARSLQAPRRRRWRSPTTPHVANGIVDYISAPAVDVRIDFRDEGLGQAAGSALSMLCRRL